MVCPAVDWTHVQGHLQLGLAAAPLRPRGGLRGRRGIGKMCSSAGHAEGTPWAYDMMSLLLSFGQNYD